MLEYLNILLPSMAQNQNFKSIYLQNLKKNYFRDLGQILFSFCLLLFITMSARQRLISNDSSEVERLVVMSTALIITLFLNGLLKLSFFYTLGRHKKNHLFDSFKNFSKSIFMEWVNVEIRVQLRVLLTFIVSLIPFVCLFLLLSPVGFVELFNTETSFKAKALAVFCIGVPLIVTLIENTRLSLSSLHVFYNEKMNSATFDPIVESRTFMTLKKWMFILPLIAFDISVLYVSSYFNSGHSFGLLTLIVKGLEFILIFSFLTYLNYMFLHTLYVLSSESKTPLKD